MLAKLGIKDDRIFDALRNLFEQGEVQLGAGMLADYGDSKALPLVLDAIVSFEPDFGETSNRRDLIELLEAHERLGGVLPPEVRARVDEWRATWKARSESASARGASGPRKVGRNEPCPCGSGKKYKKCCLGSDEAAARRPVAPADDPSVHVNGALSEEQLAMLVAYAKPILERADNLGKVEAAMQLANHFWNFALIRDDAEREQAIADMALRLDEANRPDFEQTARATIDRHRVMFPKMHQ